MTNHLIKKLLITLFAILMSNSVIAEWTFINHSEILDGTSSYVDYSTIRKKEGIVKMWSLIDFRKEQRLQPGNKFFFLSVIKLTEYNCNEEQDRTLYRAAYSGNMGNGLPVHSNDIPSDKWKPIIPGSNGESLWNIACSKRQLGHNFPPTKAEWLKVKINKSGDVFYFEPDTIYKDGQYREVWNLLDSRQKDSYGVHSSVMRIKYDCKNEKWRGLDMLSYSGSMGSGQILDSTLGGSEWISVRRGSGLDTMLDIVCDERG